MEEILSFLSDPIVLIVIGVVLVILVLFMIIMSKGKKKKSVSSDVDTSSVVPEITGSNQSVTPFSEQDFNKQLMSQTQGVDSIVSDSKPELVPEVNIGISNVEPVLQSVPSEPVGVQADIFGQQVVEPIVQSEAVSVPDVLSQQTVPVEPVVMQSNSFVQPSESVSTEPAVEPSNIFTQPFVEPVLQSVPSEPVGTSDVLGQHANPSNTSEEPVIDILDV